MCRLLVILPGSLENNKQLDSWLAINPDGTVSAGTGFDFADFLLGLPQTYGKATQSLTSSLPADSNSAASKDCSDRVDLVAPAGREHDGVSAAKHKKKRRNSLWGHDNHGRFRGHGRGSIATVRGTTWLMEERCEGSYTKVKQGNVSVRNRRTGSTATMKSQAARPR